MYPLEQKNSADILIIQDIHQFKDENKPPATLVLISGDGNFIPVISYIKNTFQFHVILVYPKNSYNWALKQECSEVYEWNELLQEVRSNAPPHTSQSHFTGSSPMASPSVKTSLLKIKFKSQNIPHDKSTLTKALKSEIGREAIWVSVKENNGKMEALVAFKTPKIAEGIKRTLESTKDWVIIFSQPRLHRNNRKKAKLIPAPHHAKVHVYHAPNTNEFWTCEYCTFAENIPIIHAVCSVCQRKP